MQKHSSVFLRKRKFMLVLPLIVIPFLTLAFKAMGGGEGKDDTSLTEDQAGLKLELPGANFKQDKLVDKLGYYEKAEQDSQQLRKMIKIDPYYNEELVFGKEDEAEEFTIDEAPSYPNKLAAQDPNEAKVYRKLEQLNTALKTSPEPIKPKDDYLSRQKGDQPALAGTDIDRLESLLSQLGNGEQGDPELQQLSDVMDKILDVQHPDRLVQRTQPDTGRLIKPLKVTKVGIATAVTAIGNPPDESDSPGFFGIDPTLVKDSNQSIAAVIHESRTLVNGAMIKLRLLDELFVAGQRISKGSFLFGEVSINNERMNVQIRSINCNGFIVPVSLEVYDLDGNSGVYIPGAITRDVAKQSANRTMQSVGLSTIDPSLGAQAANAGIETARTLLSKKVKVVKVSVRAGYKVVLKNKTDKS